MMRALRYGMAFFGVFLTSCTSVFLQPDRVLYSNPKAQGMVYEDIFFQAPDGIRLHAWWFPPKPGHAVLVQAHGNAENLTSHAHALIWLAQEGYGLFAFDYRGYGISDGEKDLEGAVRDTRAALQKAWELKEAKKARGFVVVGQSLGGAITLRALVEDEIWKKRVSLLVLESTFLSYRSMARDKLSSFWLTWPFSWLGWILVSDRESAKGRLESLPTPILQLHDRSDPVVSFEMGKKLHEELPSPKDFWEQNRGMHVSAFRTDEPGNRDRLRALLKKISGPR